MTYSMEKLLDLVIAENASDLHLVVDKEPIVRLHGQLLSAGKAKLTSEDTLRMFKEIAPEKKHNDLEEHGGSEFSYAYGDKARFRVSAYLDRGKPAVAIRLIPTKILSLDEIGLPATFNSVLEKPRGLVLVTGPTGCGKTTTLASMLDYINSKFGHHIITIEDPIEYYHHHKESIVNQRQVGEDVESFEEAIVKSLRQDPDVILVGEMRDLRTIAAAVTAAETGHLVFGTLHTIGASTTISRIIDAFPPDQQDQIRVQLSVSLISVVTQQLLANKDNTGRHAAFEILVCNNAVKHLIRENKTFRIDSIIETGKSLGMVTLDESIYELYAQGKIGEQTALGKAQDREGMSKKIFGGGGSQRGSFSYR